MNTASLHQHNTTTHAPATNAPTPAATMVLTLIYFDIPGKAEAIRLCAAVGHVELEDVRVMREEFNALQARPCAQVHL
jgi:hypothetical protein